MSEVLFERVLDARRSNETGRWHEVELDLEDFAGRTVDLRLETRVTEGKFELHNGMAYWTNPEVLAVIREPRPPNVILVSLDTLRADHLSLYGYPRKTSPFLDAWARRRAVVFENAVTTSPWTLPAHLSIFSGLDALRHGANHAGPIGSGWRLLPEILRDNGYQTLGITGGGFMHPMHGFDRGFDRYRYWPVDNSEEEMEKGLVRALRWVRTSAERPFFLFFHTYEIHHPYRRRQPFYDEFFGQLPADSPLVNSPRIEEPRLDLGYTTAPPEIGGGFVLNKKLIWKGPRKLGGRERLSKEELPELIARYDSGISYADDQLAKLLALLEKKELVENSIVIITSDHGEALGEKGLAGHAYLYDFNVMVPLVISAGRRNSGRRVATQVRSVDILPTALELAGIPVPSDIDGVSLLPLIEGRDAAHPQEAFTYAAFSNHGLSMRLDNRFKYFFNNTAWSPVHGVEKLFDLRKDPNESRDLAATARQTESLRKALKEVVTSTASALTIRFTNLGDQTFRGVVASDALQPATVKSVRLPEDALTWGGGGRIKFEVTPGDDFVLFVERTSRTPMTFEGSLEGGAGAAFDSSLETRPLEEGWSLVYSGESWVEREGTDSAPATGISVRWVGDRGAGAAVEDAAVVDPALVKQLQALGYVP